MSQTSPGSITTKKPITISTGQSRPPWMHQTFPRSSQGFRRIMDSARSWVTGWRDRPFCSG